MSLKPPSPRFCEFPPSPLRTRNPGRGLEPRRLSLLVPNSTVTSKPECEWQTLTRATGATPGILIVGEVPARFARPLNRLAGIYFVPRDWFREGSFFSVNR